MTGVTDIEKVRAELDRYQHTLLDFAAAETASGLELQIRAHAAGDAVHTYHAPLHPRDLAHPQFPWTFQRYLYDCIHDYMVELFTRTPQTTEVSR